MSHEAGAVHGDHAHGGHWEWSMWPAVASLGILALALAFSFHFVYHNGLAAALTLGIGVVMIVAFNAQYRFVASRTYATMPNVHYTIQYIPMAIAGAFIALKSLEMLVGHIAAKKGGKAA